MRSLFSLFRRLIWARLLVGVGSFLLRLGCQRSASQFLYRAAELAPRSFQTHVGLAKLAKVQGDFQSVATQLAICRVIDPSRALLATRRIAPNLLAKSPLVHSTIATDGHRSSDFSSESERSAFLNRMPITKEEVAAVDVDRLLEQLLSE